MTVSEADLSETARMRRDCCRNSRIQSVRRRGFRGIGVDVSGKALRRRIAEPEVGDVDGSGCDPSSTFFALITALMGSRALKWRTHNYIACPVCSSHPGMLRSNVD